MAWWYAVAERLHELQNRRAPGAVDAEYQDRYLRLERGLLGLPLLGGRKP